MNTTNLRSSLAASLVALAALLAGGCADAPTRTFASPDEASRALVDALRADDRTARDEILGPRASAALDSGDEVADRNALAQFLKAYDAKRSIEKTPDGAATLVVGANAWPMPIPMVELDDGAWAFDPEAGREEIIARRIGRNELSAIEVCRAIADAQREYASQDRDGDGTLEYASRFFSEPGTRDGLYWETSPGEPPSPLGPMIAEASAEGYQRAAGAEGPGVYHGYRYRMLAAQGPHARGGAMQYVIGGRMIGGFGAVAWPAEHGVSGVMTFLVDKDGVVYERDLGSGSASAAERMKAFDPGPGWRRVDEASKEK